MDVSALCDFAALATSELLEATDEGLSKVGNLCDSARFQDGKMVPMKYNVAHAKVVMWHPGPSLERHERVLYHPVFISQICGQVPDITMPDVVDKADYVDDDDIEMIYRRFTRKEFVEICERINATLYDPMMTDLIEAIDQRDMNRITRERPRS